MNHYRPMPKYTLIHKKDGVVLHTTKNLREGTARLSRQKLENLVASKGELWAGNTFEIEEQVDEETNS